MSLAKLEIQRMSHNKLSGPLPDAVGASTSKCHCPSSERRKNTKSETRFPKMSIRKLPRHSNVFFLADGRVLPPNLPRCFPADISHFRVDFKFTKKVSERESAGMATPRGNTSAMLMSLLRSFQSIELPIPVSCLSVLVRTRASQSLS